jgi:hypothetical protein
MPINNILTCKPVARQRLQNKQLDNGRYKAKVRKQQQRNDHNYWVFGLFPSSGILSDRKQEVSETGSVSVLRYGGEDTYSVDSDCDTPSLERFRINRGTVFSVWFVPRCYKQDKLVNGVKSWLAS